MPSRWEAGNIRHNGEYMTEIQASLPTFGGLVFLSMPLHEAFKPLVHILVSNLLFTQCSLRARVNEVNGREAVIIK
jgi:hypothetical protein